MVLLIVHDSRILQTKVKSCFVYFRTVFTIIIGQSCIHGMLKHEKDFITLIMIAS